MTLGAWIATAIGIVGIIAFGLWHLAVWASRTCARIDQEVQKKMDLDMKRETGGKVE